MASFDIKGAKAAGYTDEEIAAHLATLPEFDVKGALAAGYSPKEVIQHVAEMKSTGYTKGRSEAGGVERGLLSVAQGPTFGFADEIFGGIKGAYDTATKGGKFSDNYKANRDYARGAQDVESETNPWVTGLTQMAASAPLMALSKAGKAVEVVGKAPSLLAKALRVVPAAATQGFAGGVGNSTAEDVSDILVDGATGAALGSAVSAAAVPVASAVGKVYKTGTAAASSAAKKAENFIGTRLGLGDNFAENADELARLKIAEALRRDATGEVFVSGQSNPLNQAKANMRRLGSDANVTDGGGQNTKQLLDTLATLPGRTKQAVEDVIHTRQAGAGARMRNAADSALDTAGQRLPATIDDLISQRTQDSSPLYERVRALSVKPSQELENILSIADNIGAMKEARKSATASGAKFTYDLKDPVPNGVTNAPVIKGVSMGDMDHVKRGLDQMIEAEKNAVTGKLSPIGAKYQALKQRLVNELDNVTTDPNSGVSVYKQARSAFEGPSKLIDAANAGKKSIAQDEASIANAVKNMAEDELQAFRIGAFEGLRGKLGTQSGRTDVMNMWKNPTTQERLKVIFGDERRFREFAADVAKESRLKSIESVGRGSQTAARQYGAGDLDEMASTVGDIAGASGGSPMGVMRAASNAWNKVSTPESVRDRMGQILLSRGQNEIDQINNTVGAVNARQAAKNKQIAYMLTQQAANNPQWQK